MHEAAYLCIPPSHGLNPFRRTETPRHRHLWLDSARSSGALLPPPSTCKAESSGFDGFSISISIHITRVAPLMSPFSGEVHYAEGIANGFCPTCGNLLQYELPHRDRPARFFCPTCPYVCNIESKVKIKRKQHLVRKKMEPVFSEEDRRNGPQTDGMTCPHCGYGKAIYHQAQIRSADEPMTTFYWCLNEKCGKNWRED